MSVVRQPNEQVLDTVIVFLPPLDKTMTEYFVFAANPLT
jgi:hypothetical protein